MNPTVEHNPRKLATELDAAIERERLTEHQRKVLIELLRDGQSWMTGEEEKVIREVLWPEV